MNREDSVLAPSESMLNAEQLEKFERFVQEVAAHDGTSAFSEQTLVALRQASKAQDRSARLFSFLSDDFSMMGTWVLVAPAHGEPGVIEGATHPRYRHGGVAAFTTGFIIPGILTEDELSDYNVWVHQVLNDDSGEIAAVAEHLTSSYGLTAVRELHKMAVDLTDDTRHQIQDAFATSFLPEGITLRTFKPGFDDLAWLTLNAAAFAQHPEQGKLTHADLDERTGSNWFDAQGFFIAEAPNGLAGYHWTKIPVPAENPAEGEVYAVGVSPAWQGKKLGQALTLAGMDYLTRASTDEGQPLQRITLYVDGDNTSALGLYRKLGFKDLSIDRMYTRLSPQRDTGRQQRLMKK